MLAFFRRIRQGLLKQNRFSRYLLYAIGEIVLVVFGILIALRINTWNTEQNNRKTEKEYLNRLTNELRADIDYHKTVRDSFIVKEKALKRNILIWQNDRIPDTDSIQFLNDYYAATRINPWYNEPVTWRQLQQTGDLKLIRNQELTYELFLYYSRVEKFARNYELYPQQRTYQAREISNIPFEKMNMNKFFKVITTGKFDTLPSREIYKKVWQRRDEYMPLHQDIAGSSHIQHIQFQLIIDQGEKLLDTLENVLSSDP